MLDLNKIYHSDALTFLKSLPDQFVNCCITSPPYWGLRDYGVEGQLGQEKTPEEFILKLVAIFSEVKRVLKNEGTIWVNIGDTYCSTAPGSMGTDLHISGISEETAKSRKRYRQRTPLGCKPKDLVGIPWMLAFALRSDGWYLRQDIIWSKPNPMPESVTDRCTKAHEYIFMLSKSPKYYYDSESIRTPAKETSIARWAQNIELQNGSEMAVDKTNGTMKAVGGPKKDKQSGHSRRHAGFNERWDLMTKEEQTSIGANKRSVWTVNTKPFKEAHFATFPQELIQPCILAGCPKGGIVLDPFMGACTTGLTSLELDRNFIGSELNPEYIKIGEKRILPALSQLKLFT